MNGRVQVRPDVAQIHPQSVQFQDGTTEVVDAIIMATGYDYRLDFIDPEVIRIEQNQVGLYLYVFPPHLPHPTLAVIGLVQAIGAVMPISEIQSRWFVRVMLGKPVWQVRTRVCARERERDFDPRDSKTVEEPKVCHINILSNSILIFFFICVLLGCNVCALCVFL